MTGMPVHPTVQAVQDALDAAGARTASGAQVRIVILPAGVHTAAAAAEAIGIEVGQIANSLIFDADGEPLLALTSGAHRADPAKLRVFTGAAKVQRATPEFVREHTGQPIGGVAPLTPGKPPMRTLVDKALFGYDEVWAGGGIPQAVFPITPDDLQRITNGTVTDVA